MTEYKWVYKTENVIHKTIRVGDITSVGICLQDKFSAGDRVTVKTSEVVPDMYNRKGTVIAVTDYFVTVEYDGNPKCSVGTYKRGWTESFDFLEVLAGAVKK